MSHELIKNAAQDLPNTGSDGSKNHIFPLNVKEWKFWLFIFLLSRQSGKLNN